MKTAHQPQHHLERPLAIHDVYRRVLMKYVSLPKPGEFGESRLTGLNFETSQYVPVDDAILVLSPRDSFVPGPLTGPVPRTWHLCTPTHPAHGTTTNETGAAVIVVHEILRSAVILLFLNASQAQLPTLSSHPTITKMRSLLSLLCLASAARAMFFFVDSQTKKCFYEDLPKDTLVVGYFRAEEYNEQSNEWQQHQGINIYISVDVRGHRQCVAEIPRAQPLRQFEVESNYVFSRNFLTMTTALYLNSAPPPDASPSRLRRQGFIKSVSRRRLALVGPRGCLPRTPTVVSR